MIEIMNTKNNVSFCSASEMLCEITGYMQLQGTFIGKEKVSTCEYFQ